MSDRCLLKTVSAVVCISLALGATDAQGQAGVAVLDSHAGPEPGVRNYTPRQVSGWLDPTGLSRFAMLPEIDLPGTRAWGAGSALRLQPVFDPRTPRPAHDVRRFNVQRVFDAEGLFWAPQFEYADERWGVRGGRLDGRFGVAWDRAPGIYGADFAEDYGVTERSGAGAFIRGGNDRLGLHRLSAELLSVEASFLSRSVLNRRGPLLLIDGGPGNGGSVQSLVLALESEELPGLPGVGYQLAFARNQGNGGGRDELGYAASLSYEVSLFAELGLDLLSEYVYRENVHSEPGLCHDFTQGAALRWRGWNASLAYALREMRLYEGGSARDQLLQVSAGYEFGFGLGIDLGWRVAREAGAETSGFGAMLRYEVEF
jgi:hypothetical protein